MTEFFAALKKMGKLGVTAQLSVAGVCPTCPKTRVPTRRFSPRTSRPAGPDKQAVALKQAFAAARKKADTVTATTQAAREDEFVRLTTPLTAETSKAFAQEPKPAIAKVQPVVQQTAAPSVGAVAAGQDDDDSFDDDDGEGEADDDDEA